MKLSRTCETDTPTAKEHMYEVSRNYAGITHTEVNMWGHRTEHGEPAKCMQLRVCFSQPVLKEKEVDGFLSGLRSL